VAAAAPNSGADQSPRERRNPRRRRPKLTLVRPWIDRATIGVEQVAAQAGMSPCNFARRFKAATGESPLRYLHRLRIDSARHLLESRGKAISEVSRAVELCSELAQGSSSS
jgi:AraC-like DNA-binding protein